VLERKIKIWKMYTGRQGCIYFIGCLIRPGAIDFATQLEEQYFAPDTSANEDYNIIQINYSCLPHYIIEVPQGCHQLANELATLYNLKLVNGKPQSIGGEAFALSCSGDMCFTLETLDHARLPCPVP
jgi:hypothetical protein